MVLSNTELWAIRDLIKKINCSARMNVQFTDEKFKNWSDEQPKLLEEISKKYEDVKFSTLYVVIDEYLEQVGITPKSVEETLVKHFGNQDFLYRSKRYEETTAMISPASGVDKTMSELIQQMSMNSNISIEPLDTIDDELDEWFEKYERLCASNAWTKTIMGLKVANYFTGSILLAWKNLDQVKKQDYDEVKTTILSKFKTISTTSKKKKFYDESQKECETVLDFGLRLQNKFKKAFPNESDNTELINHFKENVKTEIAIHLVSKTDGNYDELIKMASNQEKILNKNIENKHINQVSSSEQSNNRNRSRERDRSREEKSWENRSRVKDRNNYRHTSGSRYSNQKSYSRSNSRDNTKRDRRDQTPGKIQCHTCKGYGHISRDCGNNRRSSYVKTQSMVCYNCQKPGHIARNCRTNQGN